MPVNPLPQPPRVTPRPVPHIPVIVKPPAPRGMTEDELRLMIERAVVFIERRREEHGEGLAREVGDYLFSQVYRCDVEYIRRRSSAKTDSLRDIAKGCKCVPHATLNNWLRVACVRWVLARRGLTTALEMSKLMHLAQLMDHPHAMGALARWTEAERLSVRKLLVVVRFWRAWLESGRDLEDLVADPGEPLRVEPRKKRRRRTRWSTKPADRRLLDVLGLLQDWVEKGAITPADRRRMARVLDEMKALLDPTRRPS